MFSSSPKLGTAVGGLGAYMHVFDPESRVSLFGAIVPVHIHALTDLQRVCADILWRRSPSHRVSFWVDPKDVTDCPGQLVVGPGRAAG